MMRPFKDMTQPEIRAHMTAIASGLEQVLPEDSMCVMLVFDRTGITQYLSNARRSDIPAVLREYADKVEAGDMIDNTGDPERGQVSHPPESKN